MKTLEGGCLCGAVRYRVTGPALSSGSCHCRTCRKASSAPELPFVTLAATSFEILQGAPSDYRSSAEVTRSFCSRCGSPLTYRHEAKPDKLDIMTCSLDDPETVPPTVHLWASHKPAWHAIGDGLPVFAMHKTPP
ncbi:GFA family protein [soil metagenome]